MPRKHVKKNVKKKYSDQDLQLALEATANGCSIRKAANDNHVPYTTLNSHVNNNVVFDKVGRPTRFSNEEETYPKEAALALQSWGVPLSIGEFLNLSKQYAESLNKIRLFPTGTPTYEWLYSFLNRHKNLIHWKKSVQQLHEKKLTIGSTCYLKLYINIIWLIPFCIHFA